MLPSPRTSSSLVAALIFGAALLGPRPARALQPLPTFLQASRDYSPDNREALANIASLQQQKQATLGHLLPSVQVRGVYTRNQYNTVLNLDVPPVNIPIDEVITPYNQFNGTFTLNIPLVDLAAYQRYDQAQTNIDSTAANAQATELQVEAQVVQNYYQLVANLAVVTTAQQALDVSKASLAITTDKLQAGTSSQLDVDRANAEVESHVQQMAGAQLQVLIAQHALESLTGVTAELGAVAIEDDLHPEAPLDQWAPKDAELPQVQAALISTQSSEKTLLVQKLAFVPTLAGGFNEYLTNAAGFVGHDAYFGATLTLSWSADYTLWSNIHMQEAQLDVAHAREDRARLAARDAIYRFWVTIGSNLERSRSARVQAQVSTHAADLAKDRYSAGVATQLDLLQAQRDAFNAEVSRIQADADLVNARAQLRLAAGRSLLTPEGKSP